MKQRFVFLCFHGFGHINACLKPARLLKEVNNEVYFAGIGYFKEYVLAQGFPYYLLNSYPFGLGLEKWINTIKKEKHIYFRSLRDRFTDKVYKDREVDLYWMLTELKPDVVLIDARQGSDFIVMYPHLKTKGIKVAILQPMLPLDLIPGHPPMNSDVFPDAKEDVQQAIRKMKCEKLKKIWRKKIIYMGLDEQFLIRRRLTKNSIPKKYISKSPGLLTFSTKGLDEFIFISKEFDFPVKDEPTRHYVGFMVNEKRNEMPDPEYENQAGHIFSSKISKNFKLLYCSFGTIATEQKHDIAAFLKKLIPVAKAENYMLIISLPAQPKEVANLQGAENIYIFNSVPQLEVLKQADLFITHGGINSIKESVHAEVPMLVYPVHSDYDPKGNAVRVAFHGLGLRGNIKSDSEEKIKECIKELLSNPLYKKKLQELKLKDSLYTVNHFLEKINAVKLLSP